MNIALRLRNWLFARLPYWQRPVVVPTDDPEVAKLADRVDAIEERTKDQEVRMSHVEVRLGIRNPVRWRQRDAG